MDGLMSIVNATEYKGYKIKEWNIVQFSKLTPVLSALAKEYEGQSLDYTQFLEILGNSAIEGGTLGLTKSALALLGPMLERSPEILKHSLNLTPEQIAELSFSEGTILVLLIFKANLEHITSFFGQMTAASEVKS